MQDITKIEIQGLNLYYGENHALKNVSMKIKENSITAFIGPSGCGKSTFLKTLNRMNDLVENVRIEGKILLDGEDMYSESIGCVPGSLIMRNKFDEQLLHLNEEMTRMGTMIEQSIARAVEALHGRNAEMAKEIMEADEDVDREQKKIEDICFNLLIQQQPVAKDLRTITAAMKMVTDMERIGDHATNIAEWDHADWQKELDLPDLVRNCDRWVLALLL